LFGVNPETHVRVTTTKFGLKKLETSLYLSIMWCKMRFDILNRLGVVDECDRQKDAQTERR